MTDDDLKAIEARAKATAIGGPYYLVNRQTVGFGPLPLPEVVTLSSKTNEEIVQIRGMNVDADRAFIEHGRADVLALLAEVRRLRGFLTPGTLEEIDTFDRRSKSWATKDEKPERR